MWKQKYKDKNKGFTLTELLVTIGIIGILTGIGTVTVGKIKATSRQTTCVNNLRSVSQGLQLHYNDYKIFPQDGYPDDDSNDPLPLSAELENYIKNKSTFVCPVDGDPTSTTDFASYDPYYVARKGSYDSVELAIGCPRHRGATNSTSLLSTGTAEITKTASVLANGQEIPPDGTKAQRTISNVNDVMKFSDLSTVTISNVQAGYGVFLLQSVVLADGTIYSLIRVENDGTIDVQVTTSGSKFEVVTPSAIVGVRGTQFTVQTSNNGYTTYVSLTSGTVVLMNRDTGETTTLTGVDAGTVNVPRHAHFHYHVDGTYHSHLHSAPNNAHHGNPLAAKKAAAASTIANEDNDGDGYSENEGDCDDADFFVHPDMSEIPSNGKDDDCDGEGSWCIDDDTYLVATDCNYNDANLDPRAAEIFDNWIDDNNKPLSDNVLNTAINLGSAIMSSNDWWWTLNYNQPLTESVLNTLANSNAIMSSNNYKTIFNQNVPLPQSIVDQICAGKPTTMTAGDRQAVIDANP
jgi:prepilin-type N-terminal cleavage/methylation domain-containing protein